MAVQLSTRRFTVEEFYRMGKAGIFPEDERVELLDGEIADMSPIGSRHAACVSRLNRLLTKRLGDSAIVWVQNPVRLDVRSELQPDVALLRSHQDFYAGGHPGPQDVLLLIEVADTSLETDHQMKLPLYAKAGIAEVWIIDLLDRQVEVYQQPTKRRYQSVQWFNESDQVVSRAFPKIPFQVNEILP